MRTLLFVCLAVLAVPAALSHPDDVLLRKVVRAYHLQPLVASMRTLGGKERLGQALFFDPIVSGPMRIACAACHVRSLGAGDGNRLAVGLGASGTGDERLADESAFIVPRNVLPFFNRGTRPFRALFWDGRVQLADNGDFETPLGKRLPAGFENVLAVASVFPLAEPDEMLGHSPARAADDTFHHGLVSAGVDQDNLQERSLSAFKNVVKRLLASDSAKPSATVARYRELFRAAYPGTKLEEFGIQHVGNALSAYVLAAFSLQPAAWDRYIAGDISALEPQQKKGAIVFFGKGRCAMCHGGTEFSDFQFHGLAVPQLRVGKHGRHIDYGRAAATSRGVDRYKFRTPPLRNVALTGPWGHNGLFFSLEAIIEHHANPVPALYHAQQKAPGEAWHAGRLLGARSTVLAEMAPLSREEIEQLVAFLHSLTSRTVMDDSVAVPTDVPSGDTSFVRH